MEHIADFFKKSGHEENAFPVDEARWSRLEAELDQKKRKPWVPFWWGLMGLALMIGATSYYLTRPVLFPQNVEQKVELEVSEEDLTASNTIAATKPSSTAIEEMTPAQLDPIDAAEKEVMKITQTDKIQAVQTVIARREDALESIETPKAAKKPKDKSLQPVPERLMEESPTLPDLDTENNIPATSIASSDLPTTVIGPLNQRHRPTAKNNTSTGKVQLNKTSGQSVGMMQQQSGDFGANILGEEINAWQEEIIKGRWQLSAGIGDIPGRYTGVLNYLTTDIQNANNPNAMPYTLADGSILDLYYSDSFTSKITDNLSFFRLSLFGNLGKGFSVKGSLLLGVISDKTPRSLLRQIPDRPDIVYFTYSNSSFNWMGEIGLQYTFYRRQRFQPYIGINVFQLLTSSYKNERRIVAPGLNINERSSSSTGTAGYSSLPGYYIEFGGQYLATPKWSIGPSLIYAGAPFNKPQIGFGLEIRYRW